MGRRGTRPALRLGALLAAFTLLFVVVTGRLVQIQVVQAEPLELLGAKQRVRKIELPAKRGAIFDRTMAPLAVSTDARAIYANPRLVENPEGVAALLSPLLDLDEEVLAQRLGRDTPFVYLARAVDPVAAEQVSALELPGVGQVEESRRSYPAGPLAGQILGFVGVDGSGLSGLESKFDSLLRGTAGLQVVEQDRAGRPIPHGRNRLVDPVAGRGVALTIDRDVQYFAETALARGVASTKARSGTAIVLDVRTGDVLAMANWPPLDPNRFEDMEPAHRRNRAVTDSYEPGSVNKVITAAGAIEEGLAGPSTKLTVPDHLRVANKTFTDYEPHKTEKLTYAEALARSSNVGTIKVALKLGRERLYDYLERFGLGRQTGIGFPGESPGILMQPADWWSTSIGTIPIGQGIAVTPLQVASVYATIANDGVRIQPRLVRGVVTEDGSLVEGKRPKPRRIIRSYTAAQLRAMLIGVVEEGTGARAQVPGYLVGGKTGTARVPRTDRRGYSRDIVTTFVGMAPADDPHLVTLVSLDNPRPRMSALTAAPVFKEIMQFSLGALGIRPTVEVPDTVGLEQKRARRP